MKMKLTIFTLLLMSCTAFAQEKVQVSERSLNKETSSSAQSDSVQREIRTERSMQTKKQNKKQEKRSKIKTERALFNKDE